MTLLEKVLRRYGRIGGKLPPNCEQGALLNIQCDAESEQIVDDNNLYLICDNLSGQWQCLRRATCWTCSKGREMARDELDEEYDYFVADAVLSLLAPWLDQAPQGHTRAFCIHCDEGVTLAHTPADLITAGLIDSPCLQYQSCAQCPESAEWVQTAVFALIEEGWEGSVGQWVRNSLGML